MSLRWFEALSVALGVALAWLGCGTVVVRLQRAQREALADPQPRSRPPTASFECASLIPRPPTARPKPGRALRPAGRPLCDACDTWRPSKKA